MSLEDWQKHPNGNLALHALTEIEAGPSYGMIGALRLRYQSETDAANSTAQYLQLGLSSATCRQLAAFLETMADRIDHQPIGPKQ